MSEGFSEKVWRLYDSVTKVLHDNLPESKVVEIVSALDQNKVPHWFVAEENELDWTPLYKCYKKFCTKIKKEKSVVTQHFGDLVMNSPERRRDPRPMAKLKVVINVGLRTYETYTSDVSLHAIKIEAEFKKHIEGVFEVILMTEQGPLDLRCSVISEPGVRNWNRLKISPDYNFKDLAKFLEKVA